MRDLRNGSPKRLVFKDPGDWSKGELPVDAGAIGGGNCPISPGASARGGEDRGSTGRETGWTQAAPRDKHQRGEVEVTGDVGGVGWGMEIEG